MSNELTITQITVHCPIDSMGDCTEADAANYRKWLADELAKEFDGAEIDVRDEPATYSVRVSVDNESNYYAAQDVVNEFCQRAWDNCPWSWVA